MEQKSDNHYMDEITSALLPKLLDAAQDYVITTFNQHPNTRLVYHNYHCADEINKLVAATGINNGTARNTILLAQIAAWFSTAGFLFDYDDAYAKNLDLAGDFLKQQKVSEETSSAILECLAALSSPGLPKAEGARLLSDAFQAYHFVVGYFEKAPYRRLENNLILKNSLSDKDWDDLQLHELLHTRFYTHYGKSYYEPLLANTILELKESLSKKKYNSRDEELTMRKFQNLERRVPGRAIQTFFRSNYRNHINLSAIADNKANIMISVNSILISVLIYLISYRNLAETNPIILMPVIVFLITSLASLIFAILSARPKVTSLINNSEQVDLSKKNIVFFGNFVRLKLDQYEEAMDAMFRDGELIYGNMTRDLYYLGKVLDKKYRFLTISYNIFMVGFVFTVGTFLYVVFS